MVPLNTPHDVLSTACNRSKVHAGVRGRDAMRTCGTVGMCAGGQEQQVSLNHELSREKRTRPKLDPTRQWVAMCGRGLDELAYGPCWQDGKGELLRVRAYVIMGRVLCDWLTSSKCV
jgi:hypothetical protein